MTYTAQGKRANQDVQSQPQDGFHTFGYQFQLYWVNRIIIINLLVLLFALISPFVCFCCPFNFFIIWTVGCSKFWPWLYAHWIMAFCLPLTIISIRLQLFLAKVCHFCCAHGAVYQNFTSADLLGVSFEFTFYAFFPLEYGVLGSVLAALQWQPWSHSWHKLKHVLSWCCQGCPALSPVVFVISMEWISRCGQGGVCVWGGVFDQTCKLSVLGVFMCVWKMERVVIHFSWPLGVGATLESKTNSPVSQLELWVVIKRKSEWIQDAEMCFMVSGLNLRASLRGSDIQIELTVKLRLLRITRSQLGCFR